MTTDDLPPEDWLNVVEAAELLGVSHWTLRSWVRRGRGGPDCYRMGDRVIRFRRADLDAYLAERRQVGS